MHFVLSIPKLFEDVFFSSPPSQVFEELFISFTTKDRNAKGCDHIYRSLFFIKWRPHSHSWDKASFPGLIPLKTLELFTQGYLIIHVKNSVSHPLKPLQLIKHWSDHQMVQICTNPLKLVGTATITKVEDLQICIWLSYRKCLNYTVIFCFCPSWIFTLSWVFGGLKLLTVFL